jgi:hypothetical protein
MLLLEHLRGTGLSTQAARLMMRSGQVFYRGLPTADGAREVDPAQVDLRPDGPRIHIGTAPVLLLRDRHIMVAFKPAGLLSVTVSGRTEISMLASMHRLFGTVLPVNILPEDTAGVMVLALTRPIQESLKAQAADFDLRFQALVDGVPEREDVRLIETLGARSSLIEVTGGDPDAIRARLLAMDHTVLGDREAPGRLAALHPTPAIVGTTLGFRHPDTDAPVRFELPLPDDLERLRRSLAR